MDPAQKRLGVPYLEAHGAQLQFRMAGLILFLDFPYNSPHIQVTPGSKVS